MSKRFPIPVAVIGVPIPGKQNPYIIAKTVKQLLSIDVEISTSASTLVDLRGDPPPSWVLSLAVKSFVDEVSNRLEEAIKTQIEYSSKINPPTSSLYALITLAFLETLIDIGGYEMSQEEILYSLKSIDREIGADYDYMNGLRILVLNDSLRSIIYREGEDPIPLSPTVLELVFSGEEQVPRQPRFSSRLMNIITRLAGLNVIEAAERLRSGEERLDVLQEASRIDNSLYYALYGLEPVENCKWTPSLGAGYGICFRGVEGENIEIYL